MSVLLRQRSLYSGRNGLVQPNYRVEVDPNHRLRNGLIGAYLPWMMGSGSSGTGAAWPPAAHDLSAAGGDLGNQGANGMLYSPIGLAWDGTVHAGGSADGWTGVLASGQRPTTAVSIFTRFMNTSTAGAASFPTLFGAVWNAADTTPFDVWDFARTSTANNAQMAWNVGGTQQTIGLTGLLGTVNEVMNLGFTLTADGGTNNAKVYKNGAVLSQATPASGTISYAADATLVLNGKTGALGLTGVYMVCGYIWNRALTADEMSELNLEPYGFFRPLQRRRAVLPLISTAANATSGFFFAA